MPREIMTLRVAPPVRKRLAAAARRRGRTESDLAREALESWLDGQEARAGATPFDAIADLVGSVRGRDPRRSVRGARAIAALVQSRARGSRKR
jgi:hypothetical protein